MAGVVGGPRFDDVVSVMFENRSFDNLLGRLYEPGEIASFEGVIGKDIWNPIPCYTPGAERGVVPLHVATSIDAWNPDAGEEHRQTNPQLFRTVAPEDNRFLPFEEMRPPFNAPDDSAREPTMDGFVVDYVNTFRSETRRLPDHAFIWKPAGGGGDMPSRGSSKCQAADRDGPLCCWRPWRGGSSAPLRSAS